MILEKLKVLDVQRVGDTDEGIRAGIDESSLPFVFELVSKQLYSNPIGSMIREITSNCFDSHIEAGIDDPVIINKGYDREEGYYIEFKDVGVGISPDRISSIYMNYFSSTKRESNTQIGAFGIGSKTPLAYTDMFYITTIFEGIKYEYIFHRGEEKPTLELLSTQEEITEHNGTTIKVYMRSNDVSIFQNELEFQLAYFDNVWVTGWPVSNDYDIYEGKYFKFRSDIKQRSTNIHICLGKVRYPIDFTTVNIHSDYQRMPIAVKFEIGELKITPSREHLRYDEESIKLIQQRVKLAIEEVLEIFDRQNPEIETLEEFNQAISNDSPKITFDKEKGHSLYIWANSGLSKNYKFKPLSGINLKKTPNNLFFTWEKIGIIEYPSGGVDNYHQYSYARAIDNEDIIGGRYIVVDKETRFSKYTNAYISELKGGNIRVIRKKEIDYNEISKALGIKEGKELGKAKTIIQYTKVINNIVRERGELYSNLRPTDEWVNEYKRSIIESSAAWKRKMQKKIFVKDVGRGTGIEITEGELKNRTGILVYGFREDRRLLYNIYHTVVSKSTSIEKAISRNYKNYNKRERNRGKAFLVLQIAQNVEKSVVGAKKTIYCKDFLKTKFVRKLETEQYFYEKLNGLSITSRRFRENFIKGFEEDYDKLLRMSPKTSYGVYSMPRQEKYIDDLLVPIEEFKKKYLFDLPPLVKYINDINTLRDDTVAKKELMQYLKPYGLRLKNSLYLKDKRQLQYEAGVKKILAFIKTPIIQNNLLTFTLKQTENDKD